MLRTALCALALSSFAPVALAGECEDRFKKVGNNVVSRVDWSSQVSVPDLSVADALGQLRGILVRSTMVVITEDVATGSMLAEQPATNTVRAIPVLVQVTPEGKGVLVDLTVKTQRGQMSKLEGMRTEICRILGLLKGGKEGRAAAVAGRKTQNPDPTVFRDVYVFSREIANEAHGNPVAVNARHRGRKYALKGKVEHIMEDGDEINVGFRIPEQHDVLLRAPNDPPRVGVACLFRQSQMATVLTFRRGDMTTFKGSFLRYDDMRRVVWLENCVQVKQ